MNGSLSAAKPGRQHKNTSLKSLSSKKAAFVNRRSVVLPVAGFTFSRSGAYRDILHRHDNWPDSRPETKSPRPKRKWPRRGDLGAKPSKSSKYSKPTPYPPTMPIHTFRLRHGNGSQRLPGSRA